MGSAITSTYAGSGNVNRTSAGNVSFQSTPLAPAPARSTTGTTTTWAIRDPQGSIIAIRQGATANPTAAASYYPFADQVNSVRTLVTASSTVAATYNYSTYGLLRNVTGSLANPYRYGGGVLDTDTGLTKLDYHFYDATFGRFTQVDPSGEESNPYAYAESEPCGNYDPTGLKKKSFLQKVNEAAGLVGACATSAVAGATYLGAVGTLAGPGSAAAGAVLGATVGCGAGILSTGGLVLISLRTRRAPVSSTSKQEKGTMSRNRKLVIIAAGAYGFVGILGRGIAGAYLSPQGSLIIDYIVVGSFAIIIMAIFILLRSEKRKAGKQN